MNFSHDYILKHKSYIDNRIRTIAGEDDAEPEKSVPVYDVIAYLIHNRKPEKSCLSKEAMTALEELKELQSRWDTLYWGDMPGYIYLELQKKADKNCKGQYFTPPYIVDYIVREALTPWKKGMKILDPACGSGQFLLSALRKICEICDVPVKSSEGVKLLESCIAGFDIDDTAIEIACYNLADVTGADLSDINIVKKDFLIRDELLNDKKTAAEQFEFILGNPPWGSGFSKEEKRYFQRNYLSSRSGVNSFTLFIERGFDYLSKGGRLAYLVPESLLNIKAHRSSRELILGSSLIEMIVSWGEMFKKVFAPSVSIMLKESSDPGGMSSNIVKIRSGREEPGTETLVPQESFRGGYESIFNINYSKRAVSIIDSIDSLDSVYLKDRARFVLGIVTGGNKKHLSESKSLEHPDPIIVGSDISGYRINFSGHHFKYDPEVLQQVAPRELYLSPEKIVYRFIGKKLTFALDRNSYYTLNNVNSFIPYLETHSPELLLAVLNSRVIQYYYENNFFTVKVLRGNIERLPIKNFTKADAEKIEPLVRNLMESDTPSPDERENIEDIIFHAYGIKDREAAMISDSMN